MKSTYIAVFAGVMSIASGVAIGAGRSIVAQTTGAARLAHLVNAPVVATTNADVNSSDNVVVKDSRDVEKRACIGNSVGNVFVWASRYGNAWNYSSMVEDVENPENNVCFVRVELKSNDTRINVSDFSGKYFMMGQKITCGDWVDQDKLEKRILDAKKSKRTLATIGGAVGGAAVGVAAMETFGNRAIGGTVQGQYALSGDALLISQLNVLKTDNPSKYNQIIASLKNLKKECEQVKISDADALCKKYDYARILSGVAE